MADGGVGEAAALYALLGALGVWSIGKTVQNNINNPPGKQHQDAGEGSQSLPAAPADTAGQCCPPPDQKDPKRENKKKHIFGKPEHNLDGLLKSFGGDQDKALDALQKAAQNIGQGTSGPFQGTANVNGFNVTVRGIMINGQAELGTAFIP